MVKIVRDPSPSSFKKQVLYSAIVILILGILVVIFANIFTGGIIALLGAVFGLGSQVNIEQEK